MKFAIQAIEEILQHINRVTKEIQKQQFEQIIEHLLTAKRVFVYGTGRSGLVSKAFAIRLQHLGISVYIVGETITPPIKKGDVLFCISGSGNTGSVVLLAKTAKNLKATVLTVTSDKDSELAQLSDFILIMKGRTKTDILRKEKDNQKGQRTPSPLSPMGTLFEDACQIFLDGVIVEMMSRTGKTEKDLQSKHMNME